MLPAKSTSLWLVRDSLSHEDLLHRHSYPDPRLGCMAADRVQDGILGRGLWEPGPGVETGMRFLEDGKKARVDAAGEQRMCLRVAVMSTMTKSKLGEEQVYVNLCFPVTVHPWGMSGRNWSRNHGSNDTMANIFLRVLVHTTWDWKCLDSDHSHTVLKELEKCNSF